MSLHWAGETLILHNAVEVVREGRIPQVLSGKVALRFEPRRCHRERWMNPEEPGDVVRAGIGHPPSWMFEHSKAIDKRTCHLVRVIDLHVRGEQELEHPSTIRGSRYRASILPLITEKRATDTTLPAIEACALSRSA